MCLRKRPRDSTRMAPDRMLAGNHVARARRLHFFHDFHSLCATARPSRA